MFYIAYVCTAFSVCHFNLPSKRHGTLTFCWSTCSADSQRTECCIHFANLIEFVLLQQIEEKSTSTGDWTKIGQCAANKCRDKRSTRKTGTDWSIGWNTGTITDCDRSATGVSDTTNTTIDCCTTIVQYEFVTRHKIDRFQYQASAELQMDTVVLLSGKECGLGKMSGKRYIEHIRLLTLIYMKSWLRL